MGVIGRLLWREAGAWKADIATGWACCMAKRGTRKQETSDHYSRRAREARLAV